MLNTVLLTDKSSTLRLAQITINHTPECKTYSNSRHGHSRTFTTAFKSTKSAPLSHMCYTRTVRSEQPTILAVREAALVTGLKCANTGGGDVVPKIGYVIFSNVTSTDHSKRNIIGTIPSSINIIIIGSYHGTLQYNRPTEIKSSKHSNIWKGHRIILLFRIIILYSPYRYCE